MKASSNHPCGHPRSNNTKPDFMGSSAGSGGLGCLTLVVPRNKEVISTKALGTVKWFNVRNGYFINRDDTEKGIFV